MSWATTLIETEPPRANWSAAAPPTVTLTIRELTSSGRVTTSPPTSTVVGSGSPAAGS